MLLRRTLLVNGVFSAVSGAAILSVSEQVAAFLGVPAPAAMVVLALVILAFALFVFLTLRSVPMNRGQATLILIGDIVWVVASAVILLGDLFSLTAGGRLAVLIVGLIVADFALFEWLGLRRGLRTS
jgi:hypothetical protein